MTMAQSTTRTHENGNTRGFTFDLYNTLLLPFVYFSFDFLTNRFKYRANEWVVLNRIVKNATAILDKILNELFLVGRRNCCQKPLTFHHGPITRLTKSQDQFCRHAGDRIGCIHDLRLPHAGCTYFLSAGVFSISMLISFSLFTSAACAA
jgi:hypothetical protein